MAIFVVHTDIPGHLLLEHHQAWIAALPKLLSDAGIEDVKYKTAYCCTPDKKAILEFEGPDKAAVENALKKISFPLSSIMEARKIDLRTAMREWECVEVSHYRKVGQTIMEWEGRGWRLYTYVVTGSPPSVNHYLLFEKGE
jgi:hypothetical protein